MANNGTEEVSARKNMTLLHWCATCATWMTFGNGQAGLFRQCKVLIYELLNRRYTHIHCVWIYEERRLAGLVPVPVGDRR